MAKMARFEHTGGPEVIEWTEVDLPPPKAGEVRMRNRAVGLNYIDIYYRRGTYAADLPSGLGMEAAGVVEALGEGVTTFKLGDRVATFGPMRGAYATERNLPAADLFALPEHVSEDLAAAVLLKGCTAEFLVERCAKVEAGWPVLVHAAAGGVGMILVQWLKAIGARVIGTVSTEDKAVAAKTAGVDEIVFYMREHTADRVRELTDGEGVRVTFDGIGMDTWATSLDATGHRGLIVSYGNASAPVTGVSLGTLAAKGSLHVTRPTLFDYYAQPAERAAGIARLWAMIRTHQIAATIGQRYLLEDAAQAHIDLEARKTTGSSVLVPRT